MGPATNGVSPVDGPPRPEEDDWFGEGTAFDSGEDLATALFAMAGTVEPGTGAPPILAAAELELAVGPDDGMFELLEPFAPNGPVFGRPAPAATPAPGAAPNTWSIRKPGQTLLPARRSGRSGWSIRNSVTVLHRTEDAMARLREQAVETAFLAAAEALGRGASQPRRAIAAR